MQLIYDGDCGFCTSSAAWIQRRLPDEIAVEPWQALDLDELGLTVEDMTSAAYWVDDDGALYRGHLAIAQSLRHARRPWCWVGEVIARPPLRWVPAPVYALVARNRHRLPGSTDACRI